MTDAHTAADARTDADRFDDDINATDLIEGDRIAPLLVAKDIASIGTRYSARPDAPKTCLAQATATNSMDDVHSALLVDGESGTIVRAGRHDSQSAWSQKEADWKVREVGTDIVIDEVHELTVADNDEPVDDEHEYVRDWAEIVIGDAAYGYTDYSDERILEGRTLTLRDRDGRRAVATISLAN